MSGVKKPTAALIAEWDRKLAASGFVDIENRSTGQLRGAGNQISLDSFAESLSRREGGEDGAAETMGAAIDFIVTDYGRPGCHGRGPGAEIVADYYRAAGHFLWDNDWSKCNKGDREIWELHAEGVSYREAAARLGRKPATVYKRLAALKKLAKLNRRGGKS